MCVCVKRHYLKVLKVGNIVPADGFDLNRYSLNDFVLINTWMHPSQPGTFPEERSSDSHKAKA